jgi:threonine dehydrogenase-like Zn-dependent dehydrogenase
MSSQVSTLAPELTGRWTKARRFDTAWEMIRQIEPVKWISHRFALADAARAFDLLDRRPQEALQVIFDYT